MQILKNHTIPGSKQKPILLDVLYLANGRPKPAVIFSHGFKGFKDWGHFNLMAKTFAEAGFVFIKFNFSFNGTNPENPSEFKDLDAFGENNYLIELNDLEKIIDWSLNYQILKNEIDPGQLFLLGHSRGGGISILKAAEDARVKKIVIWAAVSDFINRNKHSTINAWKETGVILTFNGRTKQQMPLYFQFYETIQNNKERLNILNASKKLTIPFLIIHGTNDEAVSHKDAEELNNSNRSSALFLVKEQGHTFGASHPFKGEILPLGAQLVIDKTIEFFKGT